MTRPEDEWSAFESSPREMRDEGRQAEIAERIAPLASRLAEARAQHEGLSELIEQLEAEIAHFFPEEAGEKSIATSTHEVVVSRTERWKWDKAALEREFEQGEIPDYVKRSITVDKRKFERLPREEQERLKFALTRTLDKPKVKVIENV